ncbi:hypothetical protein [Spirosoma gilvum]
MKNLLNYTFRHGSGHWGRLLTTVILLGVGLIACDQYDVDRTFDGPYFVRFTDTTLTYKESYSKPINIQVHNVGPKLSQPITINYTVSGTARENKDYVIQGEKGRVVIPANASTGNIVVYLINNANNILESSSLTFTLTSVQPSTLQVGFGQNNIVGKQFKLTIQDDCLLGGFYTGSGKVGNQTYTVPDVEITSADCKTYTLSNWNIGLLSFDAIKAPLNFIDNGDNSLTIPSQTNAELGTGTLAGTGAWNPRDRKISLNLLLTVKNSAGRDTTLSFPQTYTPQ